MTEWILDNLLLTGSGAVGIIFIITKLIPNRKLAFIVFGLNKKITDFGRFKFGAAFWRTIRIWIQDTLMVIVVNGCNGLGYYDLIADFEKKGAEMKPPKKVAGLKWNDESKKIIPYFEGDKVKEEDIYKQLEENKCLK